MKNVIIIGAGPAGLTAADKLLDDKNEYIPYEEKLQVKQSLEKQKYLKPLFESELKRIYAQFQNDDSCKKFTLQYFTKSHKKYKNFCVIFYFRQ